MHPNIPNTPLIESNHHIPHQSERDILISECLPLIDHPLLSSPSHPILDEFKDFIQSGLKFNKSKPSLSKLLYSLIFQDKTPQELHTFYASRQLSFDAVCSKIIAKNVAFYMCLDCDKLRKNDSALVCCLCKECFKASNHIGHRVLLSLNDDSTSSACDCGDSSVFDSAGFCKAHSQKSVSLDSVIEGIGLETVQKFRDNMSAAFYGLFSLIEISQGLCVHFQAEAGKVQKIRDIFTEVVHVMISGFINLLEFLIAKVNSSFILIIADFLQSSLTEGNNLLKHNCTEYRKPIYTPSEAPHQCSCPIIDLLLKYISAFTPAFQENLISFCNTMSKSEEFKSYMATIFMKTVYFSFYQDEPKHRERELYSKFAKANVHYYTNVDLCGKVVKEPFISNLFSLFHDVIEVNREPKNYFPILVWELKSMIKCMLRPNSESCSILLKDRKASVKFLEEAIHNANIHSYPGPIFVDMTYEDTNLLYISEILGVSGMLESLVKRCLCQLQELPLADAESIYEETITKWQELYVDFIKNQPTAAEITFLSTIERTANYLIRGWDLNIHKQKTGKFLEKISQYAGEQVSTIASQLLRGTLKQMGAIRRIYLIDPKCRREIGAMYLNDEYTMIDADVTSIQMLMPFLSNQNNLFQDLLKSWFQYAPEVPETILTGFYDKLTKNHLMVLNDFFGFLVFFMIDEICLLKLKLTKDPRNYLEGVDFTQDVHRVTRRVLINLLAGRNWVDINNVKESVKHMLWDSSIEDILPKLADKDEKTNKVRLKEEYYNEVDPFLFSHKRILQKDLLDSLQGADQKKVKVDPISGVYYTDLPDYCYEVQRAIFEGNLPEFLGTFVTKYNSSIEGIDTLLRPVLRLILTHLQAINYLKNADVGILVKNLDHYLTEEFEKSLEVIRNTETMGDFVRVIDKIFDSLKIYMKQEHKEEKVSQDEEDLIEKKKKLAQQKMKEIKEKFAQKQKNFMSQMSNELQEETVAIVVTEEAKEDNQNVACTLCLHKIDVANELYGFPCYINFASRLMIAGKDLDLPNQHFPALHGCGHLFHAKCFLDWKTKTHQPTGPHQILLNTFESFCPLCSNLVNEFCPLNQREGVQEEDSSAAKELEIDVNNRIIKRLGVLKEFIETNDEAIWRESNPKLVEEFAKNGVKWLRNMYVLFFESLELSSFDRFYKKFQVYADFLSCVKRQASFDRKSFEELKNNKEDMKNLTQEASLVIDILEIALYQSSENKRDQVLARLSKYIEAKIEQGLRNTSEEVLLDKQKKLDYLQNITNEEQFSKEYMPILEKAIMIYALVVYEEGSKEESRKIVENLFNQKTDTYFTYFNVSQFSDFISDDSTENLDLSKEKQEDYKYLVPTTIKPKRVELPQNYQLFVDKYMNHKCAFCRDLPSHGEKMICLLCGEVLCRTRCSTKTKFSNVKLGNANIHSVYEHNGGGMFLEVHLLGLILVNFPKNMITSRNIYVDESGLSINNLTFNAFDKRLDVIDYKKFVLDTETIKYISGIVENYLIPLEQFQNAKNNKSKLYVEGVL